MLKIDTVTVKNPVDFKVEIVSKMGTAETNANGGIIADRVSTKRRIALKWGLLTQTEVADGTRPSVLSPRVSRPEVGCRHQRIHD
jgi:hypothetical protein